MAKLIRNRPLAGHTMGHAAPTADSLVTVHELPYAALVNLRVAPARAKAVADALGFVLPTKANTVTTTGQISCLWLGPDEWLVHDPAAAGADLQARIAQALAGEHASAKDVSDNYASIGVAGPKTEALLTKLTPLDLDETAFALSTCAQTVLAKANVILHRDGTDTNAFTILLRRSFAAYVWGRLIDAGLEFQVGVVAADPSEA